MAGKLMSFDIDEVTEKRLSEIAKATGIQNNAPTIRYLINSAWKQMFAPLADPIPSSETQDIEACK